MPNRVPAVRYTAARRSSMRTLSSSDGVSWRTLMGYPSYARNRACALPSPSPFHYVMAKIVPMVQLAAHAKSSTLCPRTVVRSYNQIFSTWWVTTISCSYGVTLELRYKLRYWCRLRHIELWHLLKYTCCCCFFTSSFSLSGKHKNIPRSFEVQ